MKFLDNLKDFFMPSEEEYMDNPEPSSQDLDQEPPMRESAARQDAPREERKSNRTLNFCRVAGCSCKAGNFHRFSADR